MTEARIDISPSTNLPELSVAEISRLLRRTLETAFPHLRVRGEISGFKRAASGHVYLTLKDEEACIDAVMWRSVAQGLHFRPEDGLEVVATGRITTFPSRSRYQLVIERLEPAGIGALLAQIEERRKRLAAEGLFAEARKKPLPFLPEVIGVVTSPTGAVIRDILHRLADRFPRRVLVWPVLVQGDGAAAQVARAIAGFNGFAPGGDPPRPDLLIVARGGGAIEDLMAFNEEAVVRAAAASRIPLISAVGHETDTTLIDYAADRRAPTPTAAAEMAVPVRTELIARLGEAEARLAHALSRGLTERRHAVDGLARGLPRPAAILALASQRFDAAVERLKGALRAALHVHARQFSGTAAALRPALLVRTREGHAERLTSLATRLGAAHARALADAAASIIERAERAGELGARLGDALARRLALAQETLEARGKLLETLSHRGTLARGYVLVRGADGVLRRRAEATRPSEAVALIFADGIVGATITTPPATPAAPRGRGSRQPRHREQGELF